jgi:hypothetical protein
MATKNSTTFPDTVKVLTTQIGSRCGRNVWGVMLSRCVELAVVFVERPHPSDQSPRRQVEPILVTQFQHPQHIATTTGFKCRKVRQLSRARPNVDTFFQRSQA